MLGTKKGRGRRSRRLPTPPAPRASHTEKRGKLCKKPARAGSKVTVDSDDMGGEVYSVRRVSDYLSSHIDLDDRIHTDMGCTQRDDGPNEVSNHHAPLSQGARNQPVYSKEQFIQENFRRYVYKRVLRGEGATANSRVILN